MTVTTGPPEETSPPPDGAGGPPAVSPLVGREPDIEHATEILRSTRLLTLTGPPGVGKSRLALSLAERVLPVYPDGVVWLDVTQVPLPDLASEEPRHLLLCLDNCEHALAPCADLATTLLRAWPHVTILATSRQALGVAGEQTLSLPPLSLPENDTPEAVRGSDAVRLFSGRAEAVRPDFTVDGHEAEVAAICRRLDGIALAIELVAARSDVLSPGQILERLNEEELDFLVG